MITRDPDEQNWNRLLCLDVSDSKTTQKMLEDGDGEKTIQFL